MEPPRRAEAGVRWPGMVVAASALTQLGAPRASLWVWEEGARGRERGGGGELWRQISDPFAAKRKKAERDRACGLVVGHG
jgi:hypothetical protein